MGLNDSFHLGSYFLVTEWKGAVTFISVFLVLSLFAIEANNAANSATVHSKQRNAGFVWNSLFHSL